MVSALNHPNICTIHEIGSAEGLDYISFEYIEGKTLGATLEGPPLPFERFLQLALPLADALAYAHGKGILHRDLKPSNIMITERGPKVLDFGVAKLLPPDRPFDATASLPAMTPAYASPEQVRGEPVTTASDVFSLGTVLYELLAGTRPYRLASASPLELQQAICEQVPDSPSTAGRGRATNPSLGGDLDAIVLKALRKEPALRYPTVDAFSDDLLRYLEGRPVTAAQGTTLYRARKFVGRNRLAVVLSALVAALVAAAAASGYLQARRVVREHARAQQVAEFLVDLFRVSDPGEARGSTVTAREVLDLGTARLATELGNEPEVRGALLDTVSQVYASLGLYDRAASLARDGLEARRSFLRAPDAELAQSLESLGAALHQKGDYAGAEAAHREALEMRGALFGPESAPVAASLHGVALVLHARGDYAGAEVLYRRALDVRRKVLGERHVDVAQSLHDLARLLRARGDLAGAEALNRDALAMRRALLGDAHPSVNASLNNLALVLYQEGKPEALPRFRESLAATRALLGDDHPRVVTSISNLAGALVDFEGRFDEAEALARDVVVRMRRAYGDAHPDLARTIHNHAVIQDAKGDAAGAEPLFREALAMRRTLLGQEHPSVAVTLNALGLARFQQGDDAGAETLLREALAMNVKLLGETHPQVAYGRAGLGRVLAAERRDAEAEEAFRRALESFATTARPGDLDVAWTRTGLADLLAATGRGREGTPLAREALAARLKAQVADHPSVLETESALGACLAAEGRWDEAEPLLRHGLAGLSARRGPGNRMTRDAARRLERALAERP
jgi:serine/threonine-protein kinase